MKKIFFILALIFSLNFSAQVSANQLLVGSDVESLAKSEIKKTLASNGETRRHEITLLRSLSDIVLPSGSVNVQVQMPSSGISYVGVTPIRTIISVNGKPYRYVNFVVNVRVFDQVIVAAHDLRIETPVTDTDFRLAEVAVNGRTDYVKNAQEVRGLVPHRFVRAGSPVAINYFQQPVAVESGNPVKMLVRRGGLEVSAKGIAMGRARIGQVVKVKNEISQKIVSARVVDAQTVEVIL